MRKMTPTDKTVAQLSGVVTKVIQKASLVRREIKRIIGGRETADSAVAVGDAATGSDGSGCGGRVRKPPIVSAACGGKPCYLSRKSVYLECKIAYLDTKKCYLRLILLDSR